jgi:hypothetical protein
MKMRPVKITFLQPVKRVLARAILESQRNESNEQNKNGNLFKFKNQNLSPPKVTLNVGNKNINKSESNDFDLDKNNLKPNNFDDDMKSSNSNGLFAFGKSSSKTSDVEKMFGKAPSKTGDVEKKEEGDLFAGVDRIIEQNRKGEETVIQKAKGSETQKIVMKPQQIVKQKEEEDSSKPPKQPQDAPDQPPKQPQEERPSLFGNPKPAKPTSLFGNSNPKPTSLFGNDNPPRSAPSSNTNLFGKPPQALNTNPNSLPNSLFGNPPLVKKSEKSSPQSQNLNQTSGSTSNTSIFGDPPTPKTKTEAKIQKENDKKSLFILLNSPAKDDDENLRSLFRNLNLNAKNDDENGNDKTGLFGKGNTVSNGMQAPALQAPGAAAGAEGTSNAYFYNPVQDKFVHKPDKKKTPAPAKTGDVKEKGGGSLFDGFDEIIEMSRKAEENQKTVKQEVVKPEPPKLNLDFLFSEEEDKQGSEDNQERYQGEDEREMQQKDNGDFPKKKKDSSNLFGKPGTVTVTPKTDDKNFTSLFGSTSLFGNPPANNGNDKNSLLGNDNLNLNLSPKNKEEKASLFGNLNHPAHNDSGNEKKSLFGNLNLPAKNDNDESNDKTGLFGAPQNLNSQAPSKIAASKTGIINTKNLFGDAPPRSKTDDNPDDNHNVNDTTERDGLFQGFDDILGNLERGQKREQEVEKPKENETKQTLKGLKVAHSSEQQQHLLKQQPEAAKSSEALLDQNIVKQRNHRLKQQVKTLRIDCFDDILEPKNRKKSQRREKEPKEEETKEKETKQTLKVANSSENFQKQQNLLKQQPDNALLDQHNNTVKVKQRNLLKAKQRNLLTQQDQNQNRVKKLHAICQPIRTGIPKPGIIPNTNTSLSANLGPSNLNDDNYDKRGITIFGGASDSISEVENQDQNVNVDDVNTNSISTVHGLFGNLSLGDDHQNNHQNNNVSGNNALGFNSRPPKEEEKLQELETEKNMEIEKKMGVEKNIEIGENSEKLGKGSELGKESELDEESGGGFGMRENQKIPEIEKKDWKDDLSERELQKLEEDTLIEERMGEMLKGKKN